MIEISSQRKNIEEKSITKSILFWLLATFLVTTASIVGAQQSGKIPRIGVLRPERLGDSGGERLIEAFRLGLRDLGYLEGKNVAIEYRYAEGKLDRFPDLAAELVRLKVNIIVAVNESGVHAAKIATKTIPVVMVEVGPDPVGARLVESLACPGGNITGLTNFGVETLGKRLELLKEAIPKLARVALLYDPATPGITREVKEDLPIVARTLGLGLRPWEVPDADALERVLAALSKERPDGLYAPSAGPVMRANQSRQLKKLEAHRTEGTWFRWTIGNEQQ